MGCLYPRRFSRTGPILNQYNGEESYLDTCGAATCASVSYVQWGVYTHDDSRGPTSEWQIVKPSGEGPIEFGDTVKIKNMYDVKGWLDSCGGGACPDSLWGVMTNSVGRKTTS